MNKVAKNIIKIILIALLLASAFPAAAADQSFSSDDDTNFQYTTVTTKEGLTFRVPEDMPIENRGGIVAPIPFDEYAYGKFKKMEKRLAQMEARVALLEKELAAVKEKDKAIAKIIGGNNAS